MRGIAVLLLLLGPALADGVWQSWWELHREDLIERPPLRVDVSPELRADVLDGLRESAVEAEEPAVRAAAARALGRAGGDADARFLLGLLRRSGEPDAVYVAAALGLAAFPPFAEGELRRESRALLANLIAGDAAPKGVARRVAILAFALRAQNDPGLAETLAAWVPRTPEDIAAFFQACGLTFNPRFSGMLEEAAEKGRFRKAKIDHPARAAAAAALARTGGEDAVRPLADLLKSRRDDDRVRRSAAIGLGFLLRRLDEAKARVALERQLDREDDERLVACCALGLGAAGAHTHELERRLAKKREPAVALALGLAARRLDERDADAIRARLLEELNAPAEADYTAAVALALGVAGEHDARGALAAFAKHRPKASIRAAALEALGLLGEKELLVEALADADVAEAAAAALRGGKGLKPVSVPAIEAMGGSGDPAAADPLLVALWEADRPASERAAAAAALGRLLDRGDPDPFARARVCLDPYALSEATARLAR